MSVRVALHPAARPFPAPVLRNVPFLKRRGARIILGGPTESAMPAVPIVPMAASLFGPRGALLAREGGPLIVCDTGHHRVLFWHQTPERDGAAADFLIGQPDFGSEGGNAKGEVGPSTLNVPTGLAVGNGNLAIADAWNHRVLLWHCIPERSNQPADVVLGQPDFTSSYPNQGSDYPRADTLNWCCGVVIHSGHLYVADTGNRRVLLWNEIPTSNGVPADLVIGQRDFTSRNEGAGDGGGAVGMRWPHALFAMNDMLFVADAGNSRVMGWNTLPHANGLPCDLALGQSDLTARDHNAGEYHPTAFTLNMPYGVCGLASKLVVADTANSRVVGFEIGALATGRHAACLAGQRTFCDKGDNRWEFPSRDSLCWPYGVAACGSTLVIADSGNNRVLLWESA